MVRSIAMLVTILVAGGYAGEGLRPSVAQTTKLVYALPTTVPAVIPYVAIDKGFFKNEGLDVEGRMFPSGREALQSLLAKHAQLQSVSETPVVHAILQGNDIVTVATTARHIEAKLLARPSRGIRGPADIKGKRVATLPGTNSDYFMYRFFERHGIALSDVKIANMSPPDMVVAYTKGEIDAYFAWEPHIYYGLKQMPNDSVVFPPGPLYQGRTTVNMNRDYVRQNPEVVRRVVRALLAAEDFVRWHPAEALDIASKRLKMEPAVYKDLWAEQVMRVELDEGFLRLMEQIGKWAADRAGRREPLPDFREHVYADALAKERSWAVGIDAKVDKK
jgi:ABC-type nitrate/sulfonate/bicarbonate transport system substrate-binding protein